jgi:hypothetical protein
MPGPADKFAAPRPPPPAKKLSFGELWGVLQHMYSALRAKSELEVTFLATLQIVVRIHKCLNLIRLLLGRTATAFSYGTVSVASVGSAGAEKFSWVSLNVANPPVRESCADLSS